MEALVIVEGDIAVMPNGTHSGHQSESGFTGHRTLAVAVGITLFVAGFIITLSALSGLTVPGAHGASQGSSSGAERPNETNLMVLLGLAMSLAGIGLATLGPAISFIRAKRQRH